MSHPSLTRRVSVNAATLIVLHCCTNSTRERGSCRSPRLRVGLVTKQLLIRDPFVLHEDVTGTFFRRELFRPSLVADSDTVLECVGVEFVDDPLNTRIRVTILVQKICDGRVSRGIDHLDLSLEAGGKR